MVLTFAGGRLPRAGLPSAPASCSKSRYQGTFSFVGNTGAWLKEKRSDKVSYAVNVLSISRNGSLKNARVFEFDAKGSLRKQLVATTARIRDGYWVLSGDRAAGLRHRAAAIQTRRTSSPPGWPSSSGRPR